MEKYLFWWHVELNYPTAQNPDGSPRQILLATDDGGWGVGFYLEGKFWYHKTVDGITTLEEATWAKWWAFVLTP